ncbi:SDR family oxidoreductase [Mesorhizobium yinganensis]|uniref:SDR family oxidoreductase n=1 Tax=Mesorhizobium yinganensis TaxID=3157707 RepID=UPI0032B746BF
MNIDLDGKLALVGGSEGALTSALRRALADNGANVVEIDPTSPAATEPAGATQGEPFVLVLVSEGANGLPETDAGFGRERAEFVAAIRHSAPRLKRVVLVFSAAGQVPVKGFADFSADQAGLASLTRTLGMELGPSVMVNAVAVGAYEADGDVRTQRFLTHTGVKRAATLNEIVSAVLFLADPDNAYMTGHTLNVDGGWAIGYARNF